MSDLVPFPQSFEVPASAMADEMNARMRAEGFDAIDAASPIARAEKALARAKTPPLQMAARSRLAMDLVGAANAALAKKNEARRWRGAFPKGQRELRAMRWFLLEPAAMQTLAARSDFEPPPPLGKGFYIRIALVAVFWVAVMVSIKEPSPVTVGFAALSYIAWFVASRFARVPYARK